MAVSLAVPIPVCQPVSSTMSASESIHETSVQQLQKQLISNILKKEWPRAICIVDEGISIIKNTFKGTKVLLVLDDVDHRDQLNALIGRCDWFGSGSIIIITSRNRDVLSPWHVKLIYEMRELNFNQSFQLFCKHSLEREDSYSEYKTARDIVSTTGGLPLAIVVIGSFLLGKDLDLCKETLKKLKRVPDDKVQLKLKVSYDALTYEQKQIFLDIACLFSSMHEFEYFMYMWDDCEYYPRTGIEVLKSLSLIKVGYRNELIMHNQLRLLGREIVRQQSRDLPGKRSILWNREEACEVLETNQGTQQIEVLNLALDKRSEDTYFTCEQFERFRKLRILQMNGTNLVRNFKNCFLNLRWLQQYGCPSNFMATCFHPKNLVVLNLSHSKITDQWGGWSEMKYAMKLKVLKFRGCSQLKATPDLSAFKELEILDLHYCESLSEIHPSIYRLTKTLKTLDMAGCEELKKLLKEMARMEELRELHLNQTSIREILVEKGFMTKLEILSAWDCKKLSRLPNFNGSLMKLKYINMYGCVSLTTIPESIGKLESLSVLNFSYTNIKKLPESIGDLHSLDIIRIIGTPIKKSSAIIAKLILSESTIIWNEIANT